MSTRGDITAIASDRARIIAHKETSIPALRLLEILPRHPMITAASVMRLVETSKPTAGRAIELLVEAGVLAETTGKKRDRLNPRGAATLKSTRTAWRLNRVSTRPDRIALDGRSVIGQLSPASKRSSTKAARRLNRTPADARKRLT